MTKAAKLTSRELALLMRAALRKMRQSHNVPNEGRQTVKQLVKDGSPPHIEISDDNIKAFEPYARKHKVKYELKRDVSSDPPRWLVFFQAKDIDDMTAAFNEFSTKILSPVKEKPSTRGTMQKFREVLKNAVRDKTKHKHREGPEL